jgi:NAD(P)-dependent dehydrogenase (short-subunit alcohol dehydrogenase family)
MTRSQPRAAVSVVPRAWPQRHRGHHVVVTGAGSGIGRAIALRLGAEGAHLSLFGRRPEPLQAVAEEVQALGGPRPHCASLDITDAAAVDRAFAAAAAQGGALHALVANAGIGGPNHAGPEDRFAELVGTNLLGTYHCARAAERHLADAGEPRHLVLVASVLARIGVPGYTGYCASKTALTGLARALAMELSPRQVQVNALCPGWVDTDMARQGLEGMAESMGVSLDQARRIALQAVPLGRMSQPEEIAGFVAWLVSPDARGVTGQALDVNGGAFMS